MVDRAGPTERVDLMERGEGWIERARDEGGSGRNGRGKREEPVMGREGYREVGIVEDSMQEEGRH